jgi:hypothetical protein
MKKILNEGNQIPYTKQFYIVSVRTFVFPYYYGFGSRTVINYFSGSGSDFLTSYVPVPLVKGSGSGSTTLVSCCHL